MIPTLETARLLLRPYKLGDFDTYAGLFADPDVTRFLGGVPFTREQSWTRFLRHIGLWHHLAFGFWAIENKASGGLIGECGFHDLQRGLVPSLDGTMEVGWGLSTAYQGRGLAHEAMSASLEWAAQHATRDRITAIIDPANTPSLQLAARLGFVEFARSEYHDSPIVMLERPRRP